MARGTDVLIIGGGIIGLAVAREAARAGLSVRLFEKGETGGEASGASAGMLGAQIEVEHEDPVLDLGLASHDLYSEFIRQVQSESGVDADHRHDGTLEVARGMEEEDLLDRRVAFQRSAGLRVERLDRNRLRQIEPGVAGRVTGALLLPRDGSLDSRALMSGLRIAAERTGVKIHCGGAVRRLVTRGGRISGVQIAGETWPGGAAVVAAGAWTGEIAGEGIPPLPSHPVKGQMVCFSPASPLLRRSVCGTDVYIVPRSDGRLLVGSTLERVGFDKRVTAGGIGTLTASALSLVPALAGATFHSAWAGLRPATPDGLPAIGAGPVPGLFYACGHLRHGILLAPITARIIVRLLRGEDPGVDITPFDPSRLLR